MSEHRRSKICGGRLHLLPEFNPALRPPSSGLAGILDPAKLIPAALLDRLPRDQTSSEAAVPGDQRGGTSATRAQRYLLRRRCRGHLLTARSGRRYVVDPVVIVEVLSLRPQTSTTDAGVMDYRRMPSVQAIVLVAADEQHDEVQRRTATGWTFEDLIGRAERRSTPAPRRSRSTQSTATCWNHFDQGALWRGEEQVTRKPSS